MEKTSFQTHSVSNIIGFCFPERLLPGQVHGVTCCLKLSSGNETPFHLVFIPETLFKLHQQGDAEVALLPDIPDCLLVLCVVSQKANAGFHRDRLDAEGTTFSGIVGMEFNVPRTRYSIKNPRLDSVVSPMDLRLVL